MGARKLRFRLWRWWPVLCIPIVLIVFVIWRARQPEFRFLVGHAPLWPEREMSLHLQEAYGFRADPDKLVRQVDALLLQAGWRKEVETTPFAVSPDGQPQDIEVVTYTEIGGLERIVNIDKDCSVPMAMGTRQYQYVLATHNPGWVGVTVTRPKHPAGWLGQLLRWLKRIL